jgi:hypothetical protein
MSKNMAVVSDTGEVLNIIVCNDDVQETTNLIAYTEENFAYIGGFFTEGYFYPPQPFPSWTRNKGEWIPPIEMPNDGLDWYWNEEEQKWQN